MRALIAVMLLSACGEEQPAAPPPSEPAGEQAKAPSPPPTPPAPAPATPDEACARVIVVSWQGADHAPESVTRSEDEARVRAEDLLRRVESGGDFAALARSDSDAQGSGPRGGLLGTYLRADWPEIHGAIRDDVFRLQVGQTSPVIRAPYGYVIAQRCPVEKVHTRHILIRYRGARNAGDEIDRPREAARQLAEQLQDDASAPGADFASIAGQRSEDSSAERGGDLGPIGRGLLEPEYEEAAFALRPGQVSEVVETRFGFHVIQRVE